MFGLCAPLLFVHVLSFQSLFASLRDSVHLYQAISPVYRGGELESILHLSFMFYNDCTFISKHLTALHAHMKMEELRSAPSHPSTQSADSAAAPLMLVDLAAPMSDLGSKYFLLQLSRQRTLMIDLADAVGRMIRDLEDDGAFHSALQTCKQTLHQLSGVEKAWNRLMGTSQPVMPSIDTVGVVAAGPVTHTPRSNGWTLNLAMLLELLTSKLVAAVLDKSDISVEGGQPCTDMAPQQCTCNAASEAFAHLCGFRVFVFLFVFLSFTHLSTLHSHLAAISQPRRQYKCALGRTRSRAV